MLQRKLWKLRAVTEEKLDELAQQFGERPGGARRTWPTTTTTSSRRRASRRRSGRAPRRPSAREELERRLAESRARRRAVGDFEEPLA